MAKKTKTDDAPLDVSGDADNAGDAFRQAMGDTPTPDTPAPDSAPLDAAEAAPQPKPDKPPRVAKATPRPKRKYKPRAKVTQPEEAPKVASGTPRPAAAANPRQQAAGFAVGITVLHMGLAARVPEMALDKGEAEMLGASLDNLCREFGFKPSAKGAAVLAFAGTAMMVYAPKIAAIRKRRAAEKPQRQARPGSNGAAPPPPQDTTLDEIEAAVTMARMAPVVN